MQCGICSKGKSVPKWSLGSKSRFLWVRLFCAGKERKQIVGWQIWRRERDYWDTGSISCQFCGTCNKDIPFQITILLQVVRRRGEWVSECCSHIRTGASDCNFSRCFCVFMPTHSAWRPNNLCVIIPFSWGGGRYIQRADMWKHSELAGLQL